MPVIALPRVPRWTPIEPTGEQRKDKSPEELHRL